MEYQQITFTIAYPSLESVLSIAAWLTIPWCFTLVIFSITMAYSKSAYQFKQLGLRFIISRGLILYIYWPFYLHTLRYNVHKYRRRNADDLRWMKGNINEKVKRERGYDKFAKSPESLMAAIKDNKQILEQWSL